MYVCRLNFLYLSLSIYTVSILLCTHKVEGDWEYVQSVFDGGVDDSRIENSLGLTYFAVDY